MGFSDIGGVALERYCVEHSAPEPSLLQELRRYTHLHTAAPRMLCSWQQGMLLGLFARMLAPMRVLEIGTFTGYSALCLATGLQSGGMLHTYDPDDEALEVAQRFISRSSHARCITIHNEDALGGAPLLGLVFDMVYLDGDKRQYCEDYQMALPMLRSGGVLVADNTLWDGKVLAADGCGDGQCIALQRFNEHVRSDSRTTCLLLPLRDGLTIAMKN